MSAYVSTNEGGGFNLAFDYPQTIDFGGNTYVFDHVDFAETPHGFGYTGAGRNGNLWTPIGYSQGYSWTMTAYYNFGGTSYSFGTDSGSGTTSSPAAALNTPSVVWQDYGGGYIHFDWSGGTGTESVSSYDFAVYDSAGAYLTGQSGVGAGGVTVFIGYGATASCYVTAHSGSGAVSPQASTTGSTGGAPPPPAVNNAPYPPSLLSPANESNMGVTTQVAVSAVVSDPEGNNVSALFRWSTDPNFGAYTDSWGTTAANGQTSTGTLTGLPYGSTIYWRAYANDGSAFGAPTQQVLYTASPNAAPSAPGIPQLSPLPVDGPTQITFDAGTDPEGGEVTYQVFVQIGNQKGQLVASGAPRVVTYDFSALEEGTQVRASVRSVDPQGSVSTLVSSETFSVIHTPYVPRIML